MPLPAVLAAVGLGISAFSSGAQMISGLSRKAKAKRALANFKRQDLQNVTEGMRVSTLGAELQAREQSRRFSASVDALRSGGVRGVVGGLGRQEMIQQAGTQRIAADLDRQQMRIDQMRAMDDVRIRGMQERRETAAIAGLGKEISDARNQVYSGLGNLAKTAFAGMSLGQQGLFNKATPGAGAVADATGATAGAGASDSMFGGKLPTADQLNTSFGPLGGAMPGTGLGGQSAGLGGSLNPIGGLSNTNPNSFTGIAGVGGGLVGSAYAEGHDFGNYIGDLDSIPDSAFNVNNPVHGVNARYGN